MSAALARAAPAPDDDLLARVGGHYELTALGQVLPGPHRHRLRRTGTPLLQPGRLRPGQGEPRVPADGVRLRGRRLRHRTGPRRARGGPRHPAPLHQTPPTVMDDTATLLSATDGPAHAARHHQRLPRHRPLRRPLGVPRGTRPPRCRDRLTRRDLARLPWVTYQRTYDAPAVRQLGMLGIRTACGGVRRTAFNSCP